MSTTRSFARGLVFTVLMSLLASSASADEKEAELIKLLQSDAPAGDKALACKQLSVFGSTAAVPELAKLLTNEQLASWSRIALEAIPGPESDAALRNALPALKGRLLVGAINSLGVRRDAAAVEALISRLPDADGEVASAAAVALGRVGDAGATKALRQALSVAPANVRDAVAEGCVLCAERRMADGQAAEAAAIYDEIRKADVPKQKKLEATRGAILARKLDGIPLLVEQLRSADKGSFQIGLSTARELAGTEVAKALVAELVGASPERAALLVVALADRQDRSVLPNVLEAVSSGPKEVRIAALGILPRLGDESCVATLLPVAIDGDEQLAAAAKAALAGLPGKKVDADLTARLAGAQGQTLPLLIELVGLRRINAQGELLKAASHPQAAIRNAAFTALGATVGLDGLSVLLTEVKSPKHAEDAEIVQKALRAACVRMPEREACAEQLIAAMSQAPAATKSTLLSILGAMGGEKALQTLGSSAKSGDEQLQDMATRALGEWMDVEAGPVLLDLAQTLKEDKYKVRALRGYIRLARQFATSEPQRVEMCQKALDASTRTAEQKLVIDALSRSPNIAALRLVVKAAEAPELKEDGARVAAAIFQKMPNKSAEAKALLAKVQGK